MNVNHLLDPQTGGGTAERTFQLSRFLSRAGIACTLLTLDIGMTQERRRALGNVRLIALRCLNRRYFVPLISPFAIDRLVAEMDVVHLSGHWTVLNALVYMSCRKLRKPFVFCPAGALGPFGRSIRPKRLYDALVGRAIAQSASACVAITEQERADFDAYGVQPERVTVIPNGIDPEDYAMIGQEDMDGVLKKFALPAAPYILFLGRLSPIKGPDLLLDAFAQVAERLPGIHLVFAGPDDGLLQSLKDTAVAHSLADRVHFTGYVAGREKVALLRGAQLLAIPSRREAMSIVVLEAGMCGVPALFTDACGLEALALEGAGTMVSPSAADLAKGLLDVMGQGGITRQTAERLSAIVNERYLWSIQSGRYLGLFSRLSGAGAA